MRRVWALAVSCALACGATYGAESNDGGATLPDRDDASTAPVPVPPATDASTVPPGDAATDAPVDAGDPIPFANRLVLRFEPDAPNGVQNDGSLRDLSPASHTVTMAAGATGIESVGTNGAKAVVFGANASPAYDVADAPDLRFGATDDYLVVARVISTAPLQGANGCAFRYLLSKLASDGFTGVTFRVCADTDQKLIGSVKLGTVESTAVIPAAMQTTYDVVSFGRNQAGTRIEVRAGGSSFEKTITPVDVSATGSPAVIGAVRAQGTGTVFAAFIGKINRLYVYRAPSGTFANGDFDTMRAYMKSATPLP